MRLGRVLDFGGNNFINGVAGLRLPSMHRRQRVLSLELMQHVWRQQPGTCSPASALIWLIPGAPASTRCTANISSDQLSGGMRQNSFFDLAASIRTPSVQ